MASLQFVVWVLWLAAMAADMWSSVTIVYDFPKANVHTSFTFSVGAAAIRSASGIDASLDCSVSGLSSDVRRCSEPQRGPDLLEMRGDALTRTV
jgi:hypothetical protein